MHLLIAGFFISLIVVGGFQIGLRGFGWVLGGSFITTFLAHLALYFTGNERFQAELQMWVPISFSVVFIAFLTVGVIGTWAVKYTWFNSD